MKNKQKHPFQKYPVDVMVASVEYEQALEWINNELACCEVQGGLNLEDLPLLSWFEFETKSRLRSAGFKKETLENKKELDKAIQVLGLQTMISPNPERIPLLNGFPPGTFNISEDNLTFRVNIQIEAALRTIRSIENIKKLLVKDGVADRETVRVYLHSMELMINLSKVGNIVELATKEAEKKENSLKTRDLKKRLMRSAIKNIFEGNDRPRTLGTAWVKYDNVNAGRIFVDRVTKGKFQTKTGKDQDGNDCIIITSDGLKKPLEYKKRSLQTFVDEFKNTPPKVTQ
ncbi:MAG: hypothetical protein JRC60_09065 [Deltaproteobacteria bacterium]|nr:hypothetical protein [Deltaproteobacteria bacterium]